MVANAGILRTGSIFESEFSISPRVISIGRGSEAADSSTLIATVEDLDAVLAVNVRGTFLCYKYAAQMMIAQGAKGRIIGASSLAGKKGQRGVLSARSLIFEHR